MKDVGELVGALGGRRVSLEEAPFVCRMIETMASRAGVPRPGAFFIKDEAPNAFAVGARLEEALIGVTTGLLECMDESELEAVVSHEVGHIRLGHMARKTAVALTAAAVSLTGGVAGGLVADSDLDFTPGDGDTGDLLSTLIKVGIGVAVAAGSAAISRNMLSSDSIQGEFEADKFAVGLCGRPWALRRALQKLEDLVARHPRQYVPEIAQLFIICPAAGGVQTHPSSTARIREIDGVQIPHLVVPVVSVPTVFCSDCGEKTDDDGIYCAACGRPLDL